jgi:hypothetical protein
MKDYHLMEEEVMYLMGYQLAVVSTFEIKAARDTAKT